ncbi:MAG: serine/threonine protein kinase [Deltaproteobacteria bacterium]|nr:serine/threonine protein kinase [Deltaproteobacteria bacterium]
MTNDRAEGDVGPNDALEPKDAETQASASLSSSGPKPLSTSDLPPGTIVDKYRLGQVLGQGGMGLVISGEHVQLKERVALKFLRVEGDEGQGFRSRFRREAQICAQIKNEHITRVIDIGTFKDADYMVMELLVGTDLRNHLKREPPLDVATAADFAVQICEGLAEVHARGVVHRDLKPSNLFVTLRSDGSPLLKILDFGISKWASEMDAEEEELTKTGAVLGSPKYMAPEQLFGSHTVDARADVWSLGAILYELLTGRPPFEEPTFARLCVRISSGRPPERPRERNPAIPEELDVAVMLCLEPNIANRLPSVAAAAGEILAAIGDPRAEMIRERLQVVLDGGSLSVSTGALPLMRSGQYVAANLSLARTGSNSGVASAPSVQSVAVESAPPKKGKGLVFAIVAIAAAAILFFVLRRGSEEPAAAAAAGAASAAPTATAPPSATTPATAATIAAVATTSEPAASSAPTGEAGAPTAASSATAGKPAVHVAKTGPKPTAAKTAEPAPTPTVTAAPPPPPPKETPKVNPLEDRQ